MKAESRKKQLSKDFVRVKIPYDFLDRIEGNTKTTGLTLDEFVFDAISEKLSSLHKERRKRRRL